jgi:hypothetical protein
LLDTYYDTETLDLRQAGCSLGIQQAEHSAQPRLTFKAFRCCRSASSATGGPSTSTGTGCTAST